MRIIGSFAIIVFLVIAISWVTNFVRLIDCNFEKNYRCEAIHGIGLIPVFAPVTVWFDTDKGTQ